MSDISRRRLYGFVLWRVSSAHVPPLVVIGQLECASPVSFRHHRTIQLRLVPGFTDLWEVPAVECSLSHGEVYHYWFEVTSSYRGHSDFRALVTDPFATLVDDRLCGPWLPPPFNARFPAAIIKYFGGQLVDADKVDFGREPQPDTLPPNNRLVTYALPSMWSDVRGGVVDASLHDVAALLDADTEGLGRLAELDVCRRGHAYLPHLGVNALQVVTEPGGRTHSCALPTALSCPPSYAAPAAGRDLKEVVRLCHLNRIRYIGDADLSSGVSHPYAILAFDDFFLHEDDLARAAAGLDPDALSSRGGGSLRSGHGGHIFRFSRRVTGYDPVSGIHRPDVAPARQFLKAALNRWAADFRLDGLRLSHVEDVQCWEFLSECSAAVKSAHAQRFECTEGGSDATASTAAARMIVIGTELSEPHALIEQGRVDALWHHGFMHYIRSALVGRHHENEAASPRAFEDTVRKAIDARLWGYSDMSQAVIYLSSHNVLGFRNERLATYLDFSGVSQPFDLERRIKLGFACLLTAVGMPMILAGDEFAEAHAVFDRRGCLGNQGCSVDFSLLRDGWRSRIKDAVARLVQARTKLIALAVNDVEFIHADFEGGKRVLAWRRGPARSSDQVVVVANFSAFETSDPFSHRSEYVVNNWPEVPAGCQWTEISQGYDVAPGTAGREPLFAWEAKVYACMAPG